MRNSKTLSYNYIWILAFAVLIGTVIITQAATIATAVQWLAYATVGLLTIGGVIGLSLATWVGIEHGLKLRAQRRLVEREAEVMVVTAGKQVHIRDTNQKANWRAAHLDPRVSTKGNSPSPLELVSWQVFNAKSSRLEQNLTTVQSSLSESLDLLTVFTQPLQSYAVIGGQQVGKTFQMRHIAAYWLQHNVKPIVVGPKWDRHEWIGCKLLGGYSNFGAVEQGLLAIRQEAERRHAHPSLSNKEHPLLPVFFDDWTPIVEAVSNARQLVLEATTLYASVNIILYFILHSDTSNAWGVDKKGAALKDNFIKLILVPHYDSTGMLIRSKTKGLIRFTGENVDRPVKLFHTPIATDYSTQLEDTKVIEPAALPEPETEPSEPILSKDAELILETYDLDSLFDEEGQPLYGIGTKIAKKLGIINAGAGHRRITKILEEIKLCYLDSASTTSATKNLTDNGLNNTVEVKN